jgi:hypothetical protein
LLSRHLEYKIEERVVTDLFYPSLNWTSYVQLTL